MAHETQGFFQNQPNITHFGIGGSDTNPFQEFVDEDERVAFFSQRGRFGGSPVQQRFASNQFSDIFNEYLGQLGQFAQAGINPNQTFPNFLFGVDFQDRFRRASPQQRGTAAGLRNLAPETSFSNPAFRR